MPGTKRLVTKRKGTKCLAPRYQISARKGNRRNPSEPTGILQGEANVAMLRVDENKMLRDSRWDENKLRCTFSNRLKESIILFFRNMQKLWRVPELSARQQT